MRKAHVALVEVLGAALQEKRDLPTLSLYMRSLAAVGDVKTLVQLSTDELFHELGVLTRDLLVFWKSLRRPKGTPVEDRFWALDGLVFGDIKQGNTKKTASRLAAMAQLITHHDF